MANVSNRVLHVAVVTGAPSLDALAVLESFPHVKISRFDNGRSALRADNACNVWIVAANLADMSGLDCVEMLAQLHESSRFFLVADQLHQEDEHRCFQLARVEYLGSPLVAQRLVRLLNSQVLGSSNNSLSDEPKQSSSGRTNKRST